MTAPGSPRRDVGSTLRVSSADGILAEWNEAGVLAAADVHVTERIIALCAEPVDDRATLAAALAVRAVRQGSTCLALAGVAASVATALHSHPAATAEAGEPAASEIDLQVPSSAEFVAALRKSPLITGSGAGPLRPFVLVDSDDGPLLYLQKYHGQEQIIREVLADRESRTLTVDPAEVDAAIAAAFDADPEHPGNDAQRLAVRTAATRWVTVLAGGPGTGKTFTVARILTALDHLAARGLRIGLCAPTGRAAAALQASVAKDPAAPQSVRAVTVHSLLGWRPGAVPRHHHQNTLPHDVIVVDETSMLSMTAMSYLLDAVRRDARIVLVGDPHQLASVDAGAVLADLVDRAGGGDGVVTLREGYRNSADIAAVAEAVNAGDAETVAELLTTGGLTDVTLVDPTDLGGVARDIVAWGTELRAQARRGSDAAALDALDAHRVLCAHREGFWGVQGWSARIVDWLGPGPDGGGSSSQQLVAPMSVIGAPILVTANDKQTDTFNGDCGVVVRADPDTPDSLMVAFRRGPTVTRIHPARLADIVPAYAMTIHRSQGSQFDAVTVVLPPSGSELLTRELLYTAITRAKQRVRIIGTLDVLKAAVQRPVQRASGLRSQTRPVA